MRNSTDTSSITVETGVPLPPRALPTRSSKYPFAHMAVNDSFFVPADDAKRTIMACYGYAKRRDNVKFTYRTVDEDGERGVRIWRSE
jgi:hypothetical protein